MTIVGIDIAYIADSNYKCKNHNYTEVKMPFIIALIIVVLSVPFAFRGSNGEAFVADIILVILLTLFICWLS